MTEIDFSSPEFQTPPSSQSQESPLGPADKKPRVVSWVQDMLSLILLLALSLLFFWRVPLLGHVLLPLDNLYTYEPWRSEIHGASAIPLWNPATSDGVRSVYPLAKITTESWQRGEIPFWNPYALTGMPILAAGAYQALYPIAYLFRLNMPVAQAISWSLILHFFLGSAFTFMFLRELGAKQLGALVGAIAFVFNGQIMVWLTDPSAVETIFWFPLILWSIERAVRRENWRWLLIGILAVAMQALAGQFQMAYYSGTGVVLYALYRGGVAWWETRKFSSLIRPVFYTVLTFGMGLLLVAFQILPTIELMAQGARGDVPLESVMPTFLGLFRTLVPDFWGTKVDGFTADAYRHGLIIYWGLFPLLLMLAAVFSSHRKLAWGLLGIALLVLLVTYQAPPFDQIFMSFYPTYGFFGFARAQFLVGFFGAVAAGLGIDWLFRERPQKFLRYFLMIAWSILGIGWAATLAFAFLTKYQARHFWNLPDLPSTIPSEYQLSSLLFGLTFLTVSLVLLSVWRAKKLSLVIFGGLTIIVLVVDLFLANIDYIPALSPKLLYPSTPSLSFLQEQVTKETEPFRIMGVERILWSDIAGVFHLPDVRGYDFSITRRYSEYIEVSGVGAEAKYRMLTFNPVTHPLLDALNIKYIYAPRQVLGEGEWISLTTEVLAPKVETSEGQPWAGRLTDWTIKEWTQSVILNPVPSKVVYQGTLAYPTTLETAIALDPSIPIDQTGEIDFKLFVSTLDNPEERLLFSETIEVTSFQADPAWQPVIVDLSDYAGQEINLTLVTLGGAGIGGGWADPVLSDNRKVELLYYGPNSIYLNKNYLPRAWIVHQVTEVPEEDIETVKAILAESTFDPTVEAVVEGRLSGSLSPVEGDEEVEFKQYTPSRVELEVELSAPGLLVMSDIYYPGWNVYVNGHQQPLHAANLIMRGVYLPPGVHTVEFVYEPLSLTVGLYVSLGTVVLLLILLILTSIFGRRRQVAL
jgi:hypothetical protein